MASRSCWGLAKAGTLTCEDSSCKGHVLFWCLGPRVGTVAHTDTLTQLVVLAMSLTAPILNTWMSWANQPAVQAGTVLGGELFPYFRNAML